VVLASQCGRVDGRRGFTIEVGGVVVPGGDEGEGAERGVGVVVSHRRARVTAQLKDYISENLTHLLLPYEAILTNEMKQNEKKILSRKRCTFLPFIHHEMIGLFGLAPLTSHCT
jgi:hypothetical protein